MTRITISVLAAAFFILSGGIESSAFRCSDGYVSIGDSKTNTRVMRQTDLGGTFEGSVLRSEETGSYGKGKSDCKGRQVAA